MRERDECICRTTRCMSLWGVCGLVPVCIRHASNYCTLSLNVGTHPMNSVFAACLLLARSVMFPYNLQQNAALTAIELR